MELDIKTPNLTKPPKILKGLEGLGFVTLNETDIVRHQLVTKIIKAYQDSEVK